MCNEVREYYSKNEIFSKAIPYIEKIIKTYSKSNLDENQLKIPFYTGNGKHYALATVSAVLPFCLFLYSVKTHFPASFLANCYSFSKIGVPI